MKRPLRSKLAISAAVLAAVLWIGYKIGQRSGGHSNGAPPNVSEMGGNHSSGARGGCIDFREARSHAGESGCISGYVLRAYTSKSGNTFLDFCSDYRNCPFTSVIFSSDHGKFGNLQTLEGREVNLHGFISAYNGQAEIILHDPQQIEAAR